MIQKKITQIKENRAISDPLPKGSAPVTSSWPFKIHGRSDSRPGAKRWDTFFNLESRSRLGSTLKDSTNVSKPDHSEKPLVSIALGTARPHPEFFPWDSMTFQTQEPTGIPSSGTGFTCSKGEDDFDLSSILNYGQPVGSPQLLRFVTEHVEMIHDPPYFDWESCITSGTTVALDSLFRMFCERGDWILMEEYTYTGTLEAIRPLGINIQGIKMDSEGLLPDDLDEKLDSWDSRRGQKPTLLYTIPSGQNPTSFTQSAERRKAIYEVAERHNLLIIEDDPYYFLRLDSTGKLHEPNAAASIDEYLEHLPPSYLSLDVSGRVVRLDSTSKYLAPGLRIGWLTASSQVVEKFLLQTTFSSMAPSGFSQVALHKLLDVQWGHDGFLHWLASLSYRYSQRRDVLISACTRYLPLQVCSWDVPSVGMFLWVRVALPDRRTNGIVNGERKALFQGVEERIYQRARANGVVVAKGSWFLAGPPATGSEMRFRLTFAAAPAESLDQAIARFAEAVKSEMGIE